MRRGILSLIAILAVAAALPALAGLRVVSQGIDVWATPADGRTFTDFKLEPIPAGFFCAGSLPFAGRIALKGAPLATDRPGELGSADTVVQRLDDAAFNKRGVATTRIQVRALNLVSMVPVKTSCGSFDAKLVLDGEQPTTGMRIFRQGADGGVFIADLALNAKLLFTPVGRPGARPLVLKQCVRFNNNPPAPWAGERPGGQVFTHDAALKVDTDGDGRPDTVVPGTSNFHAGSGAGLDKVAGSSCHWFIDENGVQKQHCTTLVPYDTVLE